MKIAFEDFQVKHLDLIDDRVKEFSEMTRSEREFLNGIIRSSKAKKIVEIGVAAGSSSVVILNAIRDEKDAKLYSIDYLTEHYWNKDKLTGFIVGDFFPELLNQWELYTGGLASNFLDKIGGEIDICLLDTSHVNPGEFLDYLMVLPYMKKNGLIVIHDTSLHTIYLDRKTENTCGILLSALQGEKIIPKRTEYKYFPNIGAVILADNSKEEVWSIFNLLTLPWADTQLGNDELVSLKAFFEKHYEKDLIKHFERIILHNNSFKIQALEMKLKKEKEDNKIDTSWNRIVGFIKSYVLFPWYTYKTYKIISKK